MTKTTATFSNGHTDTYKGKRDVKGAWMIVETATGKVIGSGHSLTVEQARKTGEGNIKEYHARGDAVVRPCRQCNRTYWDALARKNGHANHAAYYAADLVKRAEQAARYHVEVVAL
jgi:hypothetical protein